MGSLLLPSGPYGSLYYYDPMMMQKKKKLQTSRDRVIDGKRFKVDSFSSNRKNLVAIVSFLYLNESQQTSQTRCNFYSTCGYRSSSEK